MENIFELKQQLHEIVTRKETLLAAPKLAGREYMNDAEREDYRAAFAREGDLERRITNHDARSSIRQYDPVAMMDGSLVRRDGQHESSAANLADAGAFVTPENPRAAATKRNFGAWMRRSAGNLTGLPMPSVDEWQPGMDATAPSGVISVGTGSGLDSVGFAVPTTVLPFMKSYFAFSPFEKAGSSIISTDHMRPVNLPVLSAGAPPSAYTEGQGPASGSSSPEGLAGFTFGAHKIARQVIATWESLQSTETPLQPMILDELLASVANALTASATTALYGALTAPPGVTITEGSLAPLQVGGSSVTADAYGQLTALRHSLVEGLEDPTNSFMLSRSTLAVIRNSRASTSGVPMFDPQQQLILGRPFVVNEYFDSTCGAGFVAYGNWNRGAWLRRTPVLSRVLQELYWLNNELGFVATTWGDNHFLAELVGASQPPTWQPLYFTVLPTGLLQ